MPRDIALVTASVRWLTSNFWKMLATWVFTVLSVIDRPAAICLFADPRACRDRDDPITAQNRAIKNWIMNALTRSMKNAHTRGTVTNARWEAP